MTYNAAMTIPCPQCNTEITTDPASDPDAPVACPKCGHLFSRRSAGGDPESTIDRLFQHQEQTAPKVQVDSRDIEQHARSRPPPQPGIRTRKPVATLFWALACLLLIVTLTGQYAFVMRDDLARHVVLRPWLEWLCVHADCEIPIMRSPEQVRIAGRDIRRHPDIDDALSVSITLANQAPYRQAYPVVELSFFDIRNRPLALRRFTPDEYLPENIDMAEGMPINTPVRVKLEIIDPGPKAVNFSFNLM